MCRGAGSGSSRTCRGVGGGVGDDVAGCLEGGVDQGVGFVVGAAVAGGGGDGARECSGGVVGGDADGVVEEFGFGVDDGWRMHSDAGDSAPDVARTPRSTAVGAVSGPRRSLPVAFATGSVVGVLGGMIGLGGAEFRLTRGVPVATMASCVNVSRVVRGLPGPEGAYSCSAEVLRRCVLVGDQRSSCSVQESVGTGSSVVGRVCAGRCARCFRRGGREHSTSRKLRASTNSAAVRWACTPIQRLKVTTWITAKSYSLSI